jgi:hypothetical protein
MSDWQIEKKVPLPLIITVVFQVGVALWWASGLEGRVSANRDGIANNAKTIAALEETMDKRLKDDRAFHTDQRIRVWNRINENEDIQQQTSRSLARIEGTMAEMSKAMDRLITKFDKEK